MIRTSEGWEGTRRGGRFWPWRLHRRVAVRMTGKGALTNASAIRLRPVATAPYALANRPVHPLDKPTPSRHL
jgi:hypothetical protein